MNRAEHLAWAKLRAIEELDAGGPRGTTNALTSIQSDLRKHPDLVDHAGLELGAMLSMGGFLSTDREVREWIGGLQ